MSQPINPALQKNIWHTYIATVLFEAQLETSQVDPDPALLDTIDTTIRPFLFLTSAGLKYISAHPPQEGDAKEGQGRTPFWRFASQLLAPIFRAQLQAANMSVGTTEGWANKAANLYSWHLPLSKIEHPLTRVSTDIQNLIAQVQDIDDIRAYQINNRFRFGVFVSIGTTSYLIGAFTAIGWMATAGKVVLIATALYYGAIGIWHLSDPKIIEQKYKMIKDFGEKIQLALPYYGDTMRLPIEPSPKYASDSFKENPYPSKENLQRVAYQEFTPVQ